MARLKCVVCKSHRRQCYCRTCIVCGGLNNGNHHCNEATIKRIEAGRISQEDSDERTPFYGTRLSDGFNALNGEHI